MLSRMPYRFVLVLAGLLVVGLGLSVCFATQTERNKTAEIRPYDPLPR